MLYSWPSIENNLITNELLLRFFSDYRQKRENLKVRSDEFELLSFNVRLLNNLKKRRTAFTWCSRQKGSIIFLQGTQKSPFIFCRLDYWLISDSLYDMAKDVDIVPAIKTDYSAITLQLHRIEDGNKGPGFWKMNTSLFYLLKE